MATLNVKYKTPVIKAKYVKIKGDGDNTAAKGQPPYMQYTAVGVVKEGSPEYKEIKKAIDAVWKEYKDKYGVKGLPDTSPLIPVLVDDPNGEIDPKTEEVRKVESGYYNVRARTATKWADGKDKKVPVYAKVKPKGARKAIWQDIADTYAQYDWYIGRDSEIIIHITLSANDIGDKHKVSAYLNAVQIVKLTKAEGNAVDIDEDVDADVMELEEPKEQVKDADAEDANAEAKEMAEEEEEDKIPM